ncbi:flagellar hook-basal body complex protein [Marivivens donghaensis]|uniref:Flagellar basal-body rod protein FlgF n=1 Tax=Marivivens donghaensis TaxID=1699413 RepID=A0ABX0VSJ5_9RHOB|nr:flagellar hook-basal body complex protein [Marivivens donghaensis]NIY70859.1 flagellar hook-basal body complex protein [Marivivens donghaensis]
MDRMVHTLANSMQSVKDMQAITAQNLANMNVPGYRRDLSIQDHSVVVDGYDSFNVRYFQSTTQHGAFLEDVGNLEQTGDPFDIAISEDGYFYVKEGNGEPGLTRRGDLRTDGVGQLVNGANELILDQAMNPIVLPPYRNMQITEAGELLIEPVDAPQGQTQLVALIATVSPDPNQVLVKGLDGLIRPLDGQMPVANQGASIRQGVIESSNVNATEELIALIDQQRGFEMNTKMIETAKTLDEAGATLMRAPE